MASLTKEAKAHMILFGGAFDSHGVPSGMLLLKMVIYESFIDTNATTGLLCERLSSLDTTMVDLKSNINQFNAFVKVQTDALAACGERTEDLLANLFKGYLKIAQLGCGVVTPPSSASSKVSVKRSPSAIPMVKTTTTKIRNK
jgi:hypothetical protein